MKRRPGRLWLLFWGRQRRGVPWLLLGVAIAAVVLGLSFAIPGGADLSYWLGLGFVALIALLAVGSLVLALFAALRPGGRR